MGDLGLLAGIEARCTAARHPLITGDPASVHAHGASAKKKLIPEFLADEHHLEKYIVD